MSTYVLVWEFQSKPDLEEEFERYYNEKGVWCQFFQTGYGYEGTKLLKDSVIPNRYVTLDYWSSKANYESFRENNKEMYDSIDRACELLTQFERPLGNFVIVGSDRSEEAQLGPIDSTALI